jgi:hypothetical protein
MLIRVGYSQFFHAINVFSVQCEQDKHGPWIPGVEFSGKIHMEQ